MPMVIMGSIVMQAGVQGDQFWHTYPMNLQVQVTSWQMVVMVMLTMAAVAVVGV